MVVHIERIMKVLFKYTIVCLTVITFSTCLDHVTHPVDLTKYYSISGTVFDVVYYDTSPALKKGAPIFLDKDSTLSGDDGKFIFTQIQEGNHTISVSLPNYEPFSKTIYVSTDTNITIHLYGVREDYFPIKENSLIRFNYESSGRDGIANWNVGKYIEDNNLKIYNVKETLILVSGNSSLDTLYTDFQIIENSSHIISAKSGVLDGFSFDRYFDPRQEREGVITKSSWGNGYLLIVSLKRNVGLYKIEMLGNRGWYDKYYLIE